MEILIKRLYNSSVEIKIAYLKRAASLYKQDGFHILVAHFNKKFTFTNPKTDFL
jgi:hypothetical protein